MQMQRLVCVFVVNTWPKIPFHSTQLILHVSVLQVEDEMIQCIICEDWYHGRVRLYHILKAFSAMNCLTYVYVLFISFDSDVSIM